MDDFSNDGKVEITLRGNASAIGDILTGNFARLLEDKSDVQRELERTREERDGMQGKFWKAEDAVADAKRSETYAKQDLERSNRLVREGNEFARAQEQTIADLRARVRELEDKTSVELTEEQHAKLAAEREAVFQSLVSRIQFPSLNPPKTFAELVSHFFFPVFENAAMRGPSDWGALTATHKIQLIKMVREFTGCGLKEAKEFVEGKAKLQ